MSMNKAEQNVELVLKWINEREANNDYLEYERRGKINYAELLRDLNYAFARSVLYQNPSVEALIIAAEKRWFGSVSDEEKALKSASIRSESRVAQSNSENSKLLDEIARLKAENKLLKTQLEKFKAMDEVIRLTGLVHL